MAHGKADFDYASESVPDGALFLAADEPLLVFPSLAAAQRCLELVDVESGVYPEAYGPNGEPYRIGSKGRQVIIERTGEPNQPNRLRLLLLRYLEASGHAAPEGASLNELVASVWSAERDFWQEHDPFGDRFAKRIPPPWGCIAMIATFSLLVYLAHAILSLL